MKNPYQKPRYLTEAEKENCYATNRGWVILKPHGKYDVVESIADLDQKIKAWNEANEVEHSVQEIKEFHFLAHEKLKKTAVQEKFEQLEIVQEKLKQVDEEIEEFKKNVPELNEIVETEEKPVAAKKTSKKKEDKSDAQ